MKVCVGTLTFATKGAAKGHFSEILNRHEVGDRLAGKDAEDVRALLDLHPRAPQKIGRGVSGFVIRKNEYGGRGFWIEREDGTETDFSFLKCFDGDNTWADFCKAARTAIQDQVASFRAAEAAKGPLACAITGSIVAGGDYHVDHEAPATFDSLLREWLELSKVEWKDVAVAGKEDGETSRRFVDTKVVSSWASFHRDRAKLRILSAKANLGLARRRGS